MKNLKLFMSLTFLSSLFVFSAHNKAKKESSNGEKISIPTQKAFVRLESAFARSVGYLKIKSLIESERRKLEDLRPQITAKYQAIVSDTQKTNEEKQVAFQELEKEVRDKISKAQELEQKFHYVVSDYIKKFLYKNINKYTEILAIDKNNFLHLYNDDYLNIAYVDLTNDFLSGLEQELKKFGTN
ncbi:hypothetical protein [Alphaproteobacteria bacterium endosymbiont of Tiliacea citrago]|uniref:hypothetical protein n=1 Tax=Alphaproteobacteria bacterium endosymbiont of Tiliacea citrago TaxID=3077944 RepID=UPI00313AA2CE